VIDKLEERALVERQLAAIASSTACFSQKVTALLRTYETQSRPAELRFRCVDLSERDASTGSSAARHPSRTAVIGQLPWPVKENATAQNYIRPRVNPASRPARFYTADKARWPPRVPGMLGL